MAEVYRNLKQDLLEEFQSPLVYWRKHKKLFPYLSKLAKSYLALPATTGSAERLFSIAGSIARARRACLTISNSEKLLCYQQTIKKIV